jgi:hypothetical protein
MSRNIAEFAGSDYGVGITGKLNRVDKNNLHGDNSTVYISVYDVENNRYYSEEVKAVRETRKDNKELVIEAVINLLLEIL